MGLTCRSVVHPSSSSPLLSIKLDVKVPVTVFKKTLAQLVRSRPKTLEIVRVWGSKKIVGPAAGLLMLLVVAGEQAAQG